MKWAVTAPAAGRLHVGRASVRQPGRVGLAANGGLAHGTGTCWLCEQSGPGMHT